MKLNNIILILTLESEFFYQSHNLKTAANY